MAIVLVIYMIIRCKRNDANDTEGDQTELQQIHQYSSAQIGQ